MMYPKQNPMARKKSNTSKPKPKVKFKPVAVRALEKAQEVFDDTTPEGRYILSRLQTKAKHAEKRKSKPKKTPWQKARDKADNTFQKYIRLRDADSTYTYFKCCTCGKVKPTVNLQAGHCIERRSKGSMATRYEETNGNGQCDYCNNPAQGGGKRNEHEQFIINKYGQKEMDRLLVMEKLGGKNPSILQLEAISSKYQKKIDSILKENEI